MGDHPADEDDDEPCYRHPGRLTALRCLTCDRPICVDCAIAAPVGFKCPDHGRTSRAERGVVPTGRLLRGVLAAAVTALVTGALVAYLSLPLVGFLLAWGAGILTGTAARRASGGYRDPALARIAAALAAIGMLVVPAGWLLGSSSPGAWLAYAAVQAAAAAWGAFSRAS